MARTVGQILQQLQDKHSEYPALAALDSTSSTAIWRLLYQVIAYCMWMHETLWDSFRKELDTIDGSKEPGTLKWYRARALEYQHGDELQWQGSKAGYQTDDPAKRIVQFAAAVEQNGEVVLKIAKAAKGVLTEDELDGFRTYMNKLKFAGTVVDVRSKLADELYLNYNIYYDATILNSDGSLIGQPDVYPVEDAIHAYLESLDFKGDLYTAKLEDAIQAAAGVVDFHKVFAKGRMAGGTYSSFERKYETRAGHCMIDPAHSLRDETSYVAAEV